MSVETYFDDRFWLRKENQFTVQPHTPSNMVVMFFFQTSVWALLQYVFWFQPYLNFKQNQVWGTLKKIWKRRAQNYQKLPKKNTIFSLFYVRGADYKINGSRFWNSSNEKMWTIKKKQGPLFSIENVFFSSRVIILNYMQFEQKAQTKMAHWIFLLDKFWIILKSDEFETARKERPFFRDIQPSPPKKSTAGTLSRQPYLVKSYIKQSFFCWKLFWQFFLEKLFLGKSLKFQS